MNEKGCEQISVSKLIDVTVNDFDEGLKGWKFFFLAMHSRVEPEVLAKLVAKARGSNVLDERRRLTATDARKREYLENLVEASKEYSAWANERELKPVLRELLVGQCVSFENFLKTIGVASVLADAASNRLEHLIFVPSPEFRQAHKSVAKRWDSLGSKGEGRIREFLNEFVLRKPVLRANYAGWDRIDLDHWSPIWNEVFRLRNAIVHSRARPQNLIEIGVERFYPFDEAAVTEHTLRAVDEALRVVLNGFRLSLGDI